MCKIDSPTHGRLCGGLQGSGGEGAIEFLHRCQARPTPLDNGLMPLDCDVTPFDNSQSKREGVSRTYKGEDGYAPMAGYPGEEGYCSELELRAGSQHCQKGTPDTGRRIKLAFGFGYPGVPLFRCLYVQIQIVYIGASR